jgi:hypothetical protein
MAKEEKGPIDLFRKIRAGVKGVGKGFKSGYAAEKTAQATLKAEKALKLKRAEAAAKAKATREANKAAKLKAAEEATKSRRGRKPKATPETKTTAPKTKTKTKRVTKKELAEQAAKQAAADKRSKRIAIGVGSTLGGAGIIGLALGNRKKSYKAIEDPLFQKQLKQYDDSVKKAKYQQLGPVKFKKGGAKKRK